MFHPLPTEGLVAVTLPEVMNPVEARRFCDQLSQEKERGGSNARFLVLPHGMTVQGLADAELATLGLQRIEAAPC